jgi:hypothetical protein
VVDFILVALALAFVPDKIGDYSWKVSYEENRAATREGFHIQMAWSRICRPWRKDLYSL